MGVDPRYQVAVALYPGARVGDELGGSCTLLLRSRRPVAPSKRGCSCPNPTAFAAEPTSAERVALSVREVAQLLGVHRNTVYSQIQRASIPVVYVGTKHPIDVAMGRE